MPNPAADLIRLLQQKGLTIGTVESATGGLIAHLLTNVPGSSAVFKGSVIAYSNEVKIKVVGVKPASIAVYGAVSSQVAKEMARGGKKLLDVDICVADTGIAGPGGATPGKPVGLFYLGIAYGRSAKSRRLLFTGTRGQNKMSAALAAVAWVHQALSHEGL